jgi:hypothetical protein
MLTYAAQASASSGVPPSEWLYIVAAIVTIVVAALAVRSGFNRFIKQRESEAVEKAGLSQAIMGNAEAIHGNAEATRENTAALGKLGQDFHDFATETRASLNGHAERLRHLEVRDPRTLRQPFSRAAAFGEISPLMTFSASSGSSRLSRAVM